jgi:hypothetical protein
MPHNNQARSKPTRLKILVPIAILIFLIAALLFVLVLAIFPLQKETKNYNSAVFSYNAKVANYQELTQKASIDNISGFLADIDTLDCVEENFSSVLQSFFQGNNARKTQSDIQELNKMTDLVQSACDTIQQITFPSENWVVERLRNVEGVADIQAVTEDNDPNGMLNKDGGYSSCIYFTCSNVDSTAISGDDPVSKGTDGGGAIEIYPLLEDAEARCEYLSQFDHTVLYSGSYVLIGTMVVRTSYLLSGDEQYQLTNRIVTELTKLD